MGTLQGCMKKCVHSTEKAGRCQSSSHKFSANAYVAVVAVREVMPAGDGGRRQVPGSC